MTPTTAKSIVSEMTQHVRQRLTGLPGVTENAVLTLVFSWIRSEQPALLEVLDAKGVCVVIAVSKEKTG